MGEAAVQMSRCWIRFCSLPLDVSRRGAAVMFGYANVSEGDTVVGTPSNLDFISRFPFQTVSINLPAIGGSSHTDVVNIVLFLAEYTLGEPGLSSGFGLQ